MKYKITNAKQKRQRKTNDALDDALTKKHGHRKGAALKQLKGRKM